MRLIQTAALAGLVAFPALAIADPVHDALEARKGYMKMISINMEPLAGMAKGEVEYDEAAASTAAANIETLSMYTLPALFIEGSAEGEAQGSEALPAIWEKPEQFAEKYAAFQEAAKGATDAVKGGQGNVGPVLQKLGGACKGCHDDFRKKD